MINKNLTLNKIALLDSGADQNCIVEGLIPTKYLEKGTSRLYSATGERLKINYKLSKAHICNNGIYFVNDFVITRDINEEIILGIPFLSQIKPYFTELDSIKTTILGKKIIFPFLKPMTIEDNAFLKSKIIFKLNLLTKQLNFLKEYIKIKKIELVFKTLEMSDKITCFQKKL